MSAEQALLDALAAAIVLGPDDKLVLAFKDLSPAQVQELREQLDATAFGGRVLVVSGAAELAVLRGDR